MKKFPICLCLILLTFFAQSQDNDLLIIAAEKGDIRIQPILHSTMAIHYDGKVIYTDPYGGAEAFKGVPNADMILITDIHGDHMNLETLKVLDTENAAVIAPQAVADKVVEDFPDVLVLSNGESMEMFGVSITAIPMYNLPETEESRHPKGRGNGYILEIGGVRIYISGDTSDISEMRNLKEIDVAFVCMNLPYTMSVDAAAAAVLDFKPTIVYPFHYRGKGGFSDVNKFKSLVNDQNSEIEVRLVNWYPEK